MIIETAVLATLLREPITKLSSWTLTEALKGTRNQNIEKSLKTLSARITEVARVKTIYKGDESIDLHEFYVPTRVNNVNRLIDCVSKIDSQSIVLEGTVGQGKSIFMRYLTYQEANKGSRIPIFFELRRLEEKQSLQEAISTTISNWIPLFSKENFEKVARGGDLVLFLDGFDEIPHERVTTILNEIEGWRERYTEMQIIISARPESEIQKSNYLKVYKLSTYNNPEQEKLVDKLFKDLETRVILKKAIKDSTVEIQELLKTPLMVTLFIMKYRASLEIPKNQSEFYQELFSILISRHDKTKPGYKRELNSGLSEKMLQVVFEEFCFYTCNTDNLTFSYVDAIKFIEKSLQSQRLAANSELILADFSKVICLLLRDGIEYTFIHKSIQEYFYASFISKKSESAKESFYLTCSKRFEIYARLINIIEILETLDKYSFYKNYIYPPIIEFIDCYQITSIGNDIIDNIFINNQNNNFLVLNRLGRLTSHLHCLPPQISGLLHFIATLINEDGQSHCMYSIYDVQMSTSVHISLKSYLNADSLHKAYQESIIIGKAILEFRAEIERNINGFDSIDFDFI